MPFDVIFAERFIVCHFETKLQVKYPFVHKNSDLTPNISLYFTFGDNISGGYERTAGTRFLGAFAQL